jgi:hypothetical protein
MFDTTQILLMSAITIMTVIFTIVGIQLIFILRDMRTLVSKANSVVSEVEKLGGSFGNGYSELMGFFGGVKNVFHLVDAISKKKKKS